MMNQKRRSPSAQLAAMRRQWPAFEGTKTSSGMLLWAGPLQPKAQVYYIRLAWHPSTMTLPLVFIVEPRLRPREGGTFEDIPHLIFDSEEPERSALCLFDPDGNEWSPIDLIAETTLPWAAEWLLYYELWHMTGEWLGPGVGYESIAEMHLDEARRARGEVDNVH